MDPNANLAEQLELARQSQAINDAGGDELTEDQELELVAIATRLAELVLALNEWIARGGFLPAVWRGRAK